MNRPDILQRLGGYPPPAGSPATMGLEVAGEVAIAAGRWKVGDKVCALLGGGGYAEYAVVDARHALPIPDGFSFAEAAGLPETVFTVYANVFEHGSLKAGETLLLHGATSGIGVTAIQMAKAAGAKVIATGRGADKAKAALALGADVAVDTTTEDFAEVAKAQGGVDVVLDMVGGDYVLKNLDALKTGGRIVFIAALGGGQLNIPIFAIMMKRAVITGSTLRPPRRRRESAPRRRDRAGGLALDRRRQGQAADRRHLPAGRRRRRPRPPGSRRPRGQGDPAGRVTSLP